MAGTEMAKQLSAPHPRFIPHGSGERIKVRSGWLSYVAVGEQTGGAYAVIETANDPSTGVPLHVLEREDETWFVLEGEYTFEVGDQTFRAGPGDYVFGHDLFPTVCQPDGCCGAGFNHGDSSRL
jgi:quercetin dioxygenase-like cupin family protein